MQQVIETEQDLQKLIGQYESIRLEFKASALLAQPPDRIIKQLAEEVSAFANTEGGTIVIGIKESKSGKKSVASEVDEGTDPAEMLPERLEQLVASNISPPVPGLVVRPIPLSGQKTGRVAFAIAVPKGSTAYQARHSLLYYGRTEFAATPLHDNVIRLLMMRGKVAHAVIELGAVSRLTAESEYQRRQVELKRCLQRRAEEEEVVVVSRKKRIELEAPKRNFDEYIFDLLIRNDGPVTIRDSLLTLSFQVPPTLQVTHERRLQPWQFRLAPTTRTIQQSPSGGRQTEILPHSFLFPENSMPFPEASFTVRLPRAHKLAEAVLNWKLYLDDAPSTSGSIDLARGFEQAKESPKET
jgi:hypothetical protein